MKRKAHFQRTFAAQTSFEKHGRKSRREEFLKGMEVVVPWRELEALIRAVLSQGRQWPPAGWVVDYAARLLSAAVV